MPSAYLDRLLRAAMKRRALDTLALRALMKATSLLGLALAERLRHYRDSRDPMLDRFAQLQEQTLHVALLQEALDILGARWDKLPEHRRPHFTPQARFRILRLGALLAWPARDTARTFRVSVGTILRWQHEASSGRQVSTIGSLLKPVPPVHRYCDLARHLVQTLVLAGFPGDRSTAAHLARAGWQLSRRTIGRIRKEKPIEPPGLSSEHATPARAVRARFPHHVWMLDLTEIPGFLNLFSFKLAVVFDAFSRLPLTAKIFLSEPSGEDLARLFRGAVSRFGPPRHSVSDQGPQFTAQVFRRALASHGVRHRYGALGRSGSIALIERFFRTLKALAQTRPRPPFLNSDLERRLEAAFYYYAFHRPHQGLKGSTPAERFLDAPPAHLDAVPPPRGWTGENVALTPPFEVRHLDGQLHLPYLVRRAA